MLTFRDYHVKPILNGEKTQTRRVWKRNHAVPSAIHRCRTNRFKAETEFCKVKILRVWKQRLGDISQADVIAEGSEDKVKFIEMFCEINKLPMNQDTFNKEIYAIEFEVLK